MNDNPRRRAEHISRGAILAAAALCALQLVFVIQLHRGLLLGALWLAGAVALWMASRRPHMQRLLIARLALPAMALLYLAEARLGRSAPRDGTVAARRGAPFDTRTQIDVVRDERARGVDAYASIQPRQVLEDGGVEIDGRRVVPLGGIGGKRTVLCNEGGVFAAYDSDRHGFNNPPGMWGERGAVDVGVVGESFMHGACVPEGKGAVDVIRARFLSTVNLGMVGNGPLAELGGILEYLTHARPKIVLWSYYHNDLGTLEAEKASPILRAYVDSDTRYGFISAQDKVDAALIDLAKRKEATAPAWPRIGLPRGATPKSLQDLLTGSDHTTLGAALRFDRLSGFVMAKTTWGKAAPPDFALFKRVLEKAKRTVSAWGGTLHFVYLADLHNLRGPDHPLRKPVLDLVKEVGLPVIDVHPAFAGVPDPMTLRYHAESHCNEEGNRLIGATVLNALR